MWWAGLMRGAVTIALSYNQVTSNIRVVLLTFQDDIFSSSFIHLYILQLQFSSSDDTSSKDSAQMITSTIIVVLFSTVVH